MILAESLLDLLRDPSHWLFEWIHEGATSLLLYPAARWLWRRHHERRHPTDQALVNKEN